MTAMPVWFLAFERFQLLDVSGPLQVFATANDELRLMGREAAYRTRVLAESVGPVTSSNGLVVNAQAWPVRMRPRRSGQPDGTVIVPGGPAAWNPATQASDSGTDATVSWLRRNGARFERVASVCTGAFLLGRAGLLDGCRVATHWAACDSLGATFPNIEVQQDAIYFRDGRRWTSAGVTAGIDMALGMVEVDLGRAMAISVAKKLVVFFKRPGGQSQFSSALLAQGADDPRIEALHAWIDDHLHESIGVPRLSDRMAMAPRTFARFYLQRTGDTPAHAIERMRLDRASRLLESSATSIKTIAQRCGFGSEELMRRAFKRRFGVPPLEYRARFR